jgi:hypothetical protein
MLVISPPVVKFDNEESRQKTLYQAKLSPASMLNVNLSAKEQLKSGLLSKASELRPAVRESDGKQNADDLPSTSTAKSPSVVKVPKWLKLGKSSK